MNLVLKCMCMPKAFFLNKKYVLYIVCCALRSLRKTKAREHNHLLQINFVKNTLLILSRIFNGKKKGNFFSFVFEIDFE